MFSDFDAEELSIKGVKMPLENPKTGELLEFQSDDDLAPRGAYLTLLGPDSPETKRALQRLINAEASMKDKGEKSNDQYLADKKSLCRMLSKLTVDGLVFGVVDKNLPDAKGAWVPITSDNSYGFYMGASDFRRQAQSFIIKPSNFYKG